MKLYRDFYISFMGGLAAACCFFLITKFADIVSERTTGSILWDVGIPLFVVVILGIIVFTVTYLVVEAIHR